MRHVGMVCRAASAAVVIACAGFAARAQEERGLQHVLGASRAGDVIPVGGDRSLVLWREEVPGLGERPHFAYVDRLGRVDAALAGRARATSYTIGLRYARFDPLTDVPAVAPGLEAPAENDVYIVQFWATPLDEMRAEVEALGGTIHGFLERHAHIVALPARARRAVQQLPYVRWVGPYHPAYKLDDRILSAFATAFEEGGIAGTREGRGDFYSRGEYSVSLFERGGRAQGALKGFIERIGGRVSVLTPDAHRLQATLTPDQLLQVARRADVQSISPWGLGGGDMDLVRQLGGADYVETQTGFTGEGVRTEAFDDGLLTSHVEWPTSPIQHSPNTGSGCHGTPVFGILNAQGVDPQARGLVPGHETGYFYLFSDSTQFGGSETRLQIAQDLVAPSGTVSQTVVQTSSFGNTRTPLYTSIAAEMDDVILQTGLLHTQSQSNAGGNPFQPPQNSRPQAWAKNMLSCGAVNHLNTATRTDDRWLNSTGTSTGPAEDCRVKPDLCFFYDLTYTSSCSGGYTQFGGTSGATPSVAGHTALFQQMWHRGVWPASGGLGGGTVFTNRPFFTTVKAALINTAFRYDWYSTGVPAPNQSINRYVQGWGMPDLANLYDLRGRTYYANEPFLLGQGQRKTHYVRVRSGEPALNVTMSYADVPGTPGVLPHRVNDLSLKVTAPGGRVYWGNDGLGVAPDPLGCPPSPGGGSPPADGRNFSNDPGAILTGLSNEVDTVENVFIDAPAAGVWRIDVIGDVVVADTHTETVGTDADYALWVTGGIETHSLKTTFRGGKGLNGGVFAVYPQKRIFANAIDFSFSTEETITVEVYMVRGNPRTYAGTPSAWRLVARDRVTAKGPRAATTIKFPSSVTLDANQIYGFYVTEVGVASGFMLSTPGDVKVANYEATIKSDFAMSYPFGTVVEPCAFNGVLYYKYLTTTPTLPTLPLATPLGGCPADCDGNGELNVLDFVCFQQLFVEGDHRADYDLSTGIGVLDVYDFLQFQEAFLRGCE